MKNTILFLALILTSTFVYALETTNIQLRQGTTNDGAVIIYRDNDGNLMFEDTYTDPTSLSLLRQSATSHAALTGLDLDSHTQYLNTTRHSSSHDSPFNLSLPISADTNGNTTLGSHVEDEEIHPNLMTDTAIAGTWDFTNGVNINSGKIVIDINSSTSYPTITFIDQTKSGILTFTPTGDGALSWNRPFSVPDLAVTGTLSGLSGGSPTAQLDGFAQIQGIATTDLLSSTRQESISGSWSFQSTLTANTALQTPKVVLTANPSMRMIVQNISDNPVSVGDPLLWAGYNEGQPQVIKATTLLTTTMPLAGFSCDSALTSGTMTMQFQGTFSLPVSTTFSLGTLVGWDGTGACDVSTITNGKTIGVALQPGIVSSNAVVMIDF